MLIEVINNTCLRDIGIRYKLCLTSIILELQWFSGWKFYILSFLSTPASFEALVMGVVLWASVWKLVSENYVGYLVV